MDYVFGINEAGGRIYVVDVETREVVNSVDYTPTEFISTKKRPGYIICGLFLEIDASNLHPNSGELQEQVQILSYSLLTAEQRTALSRIL